MRIHIGDPASQPTDLNSLALAGHLSTGRLTIGHPPVQTAPDPLRDTGQKLADAISAATAATAEHTRALTAAQHELQAALTPPAAPTPAVGVRVELPSARDSYYAAGRSWFADDRDRLTVEDAHGRPIAEFPAGHWVRAELLLAESA